MMVKQGDSGVNDFIRNDLQRYHPKIRIEDTPQFYDLSVFNRCAETGKVLLTIECWQEVHPGLVSILVNWDYSIPYGLLYSFDAPKDVLRFVETVKEALSAQEVKIASVAGGFPSSQTFMEIKIAETAMAVMQGADEIDVVMNLGYFLEENYDELSEEIQEIKESCRDAKLKVILETGALQTPESIQKAAVLAVYSGADFIKTSTGKGYPGATFEAAYTMCKAIKTYHSITGNKVGIKISGGVRTAEDAVRYYTIVKEILGDEWLNKDLFRIGASSLVGDIEKRLGK